MPSPEPGAPEFGAYMQAWTDYTNELTAAGALVASEALLPVETATTVRHKDGATQVLDGPFVELKEHLGGFYLIDVDTLDDAIEWARKLPVGEGAVEVRPIMDLSAFM
nr:YciI family protein [Demequina sp. TTPB684]